MHSTSNLRDLRKSRRIWQKFALALGFGILVCPLIAAFYEYSYLQSLSAILLLFICLYPTARYFARFEGGVPVIAILCLAYAIQFSIPIFTGKPEIALAYGEIKYLEDAYIVFSLILLMLGVLALQFGYYSLQHGRIKRYIPTFDLHLNEKKAILFCILVGILLPLSLGVRSILSQEQSVQYAAIFTLLQNQQLVVIGILGWIVYSGRGTRWHKLVLYSVVVISTWRGLSSAFLEQAVIPITILFITKWLYGKRVSVVSIIAIIVIVIFLSPVKASFREFLGSDSTETSLSKDLINSPLNWIEQASQYWTETLSGERGIAEATNSATSRTDLIHQFAHIYSLTPEIVPYQFGGTYSYFAVAIIPRALWPDKPQAGGANNFYAVAYNITSEEGAKRSTFGVSLIGEGYLNFGIFGVLLIMALQGVILALLQLVFGGPKSGTGGQAVFLAFFVFFLNGVGTSAEIFFGNIVQNLLCSCFLLLWVREKPSVRRLAKMGIAETRGVQVS